MIIKICGITRPGDAAHAVRAGADWIGLNFWPRSKRFIEPEAARAVADAARAAGPVTVVGVFVNQNSDHVDQIATEVGLDLVQLHGDESPADCARFAGRYLKAIPLRALADIARIDTYDCDVCLVDTPTPDYGGSGRVGDWDLARSAVASGRKILLAGGLRHDNVADAIAAVAPYGVDVAGGVEASPGIKDSSLVERFVAAAKAANPPG